MLRIATEAEKRERDRLTYSAWGGGLTEAQWQEREARLRAHPWCQRGMTTWVLTDSSDAILSSCETFLMPSSLGREAGHAYGVASVLTEPALRGRGHAASMMSELVERLDRDDPKAQASILFSDVGASLYARAGYRPVPALDRFFTPTPETTRIDADVLETSVPAALERIRSPEGHFRVHATAEQIDWHLDRERFYAQTLGRTRPSACGAQVGESTALWACLFKSEELHVLVLDARTASDADRLIGAARRAAHQAGLARVRWWEAPLGFSWSGGERRPREGSLPMLCPLAPGLTARDWVDVWRALWV